MSPLRRGARSFCKRQKIQLFSFLLIITEIAGMHDPENKARSWESPPEDSPASFWPSTVCLPSWMPPTPGMSEVEAVPPSPEELSPGTLHYAPTSQTPEAERRERKKNQDGEWLKTLPSLSSEAYFHSKLIKKRTKTTWRANNQKPDFGVGKQGESLLLSNFTVIQNCWAIKHWSEK